MVLLRERTRRIVGFIEPCLPRPAKRPPPRLDPTIHFGNQVRVLIKRLAP